jgi:hypothetical protein
MKSPQMKMLTINQKAPNGIRPSPTTRSVLLRAMMSGMNSKPQLRPNDAPIPDTSMRLGLIGLKIDATVITMPAARYAGQTRRRLSHSQDGDSPLITAAQSPLFVHADATR